MAQTQAPHVTNTPQANQQRPPKILRINLLWRNRVTGATHRETLRAATRPSDLPNVSYLFALCSDPRDIGNADGGISLSRKDQHRLAETVSRPSQDAANENAGEYLSRDAGCSVRSLATAVGDMREFDCM